MSMVKNKFNELLSTVWGERLKILGFKKRGEKFIFEHRDGVGIINFQKSQRSSSEILLFTINIGIFSYRLYRFLSGNPDIKKMNIEDCHLRIRVGYILPAQEDKWWSMDVNTNLHELSSDINCIIEEYVIDYIRKCLGDQELKNLWIEGRSPGLTDIQRLIYLSILLHEIGPVELLEPTIAVMKKMSAGKPVATTVNHVLKKMGLNQ